jgi:hypothetical protein
VLELEERGRWRKMRIMEGEKIKEINQHVSGDGRRSAACGGDASSSSAV